jgi:hypothetical protein
MSRAEWALVVAGLLGFSLAPMAAGLQFSDLQFSGLQFSDLRCTPPRISWKGLMRN